jgi:beta-xylosidase
VPKSGFLYVFFRDPGDSGIYFAASEDALRWRTLNEGHPMLSPEVAGTRTRDPFIVRDPGGGGFHLVWTAGGQPPRLGYAHSPDLATWREVNFFTPFPTDTPVQNIWAPELAWDDATGEWVVFWSSTIDGRFPETEGQVANRRNHRIYSSTTRDFVSLTEPTLFFDPGFPVIDASLAQDGKRWILAIKDERDTPLRKRLHIATGPSLRGPWTPLGPPLTPEWTEGPSLLRVDGGWLLFHDQYRGENIGMRALHTHDLELWTDVSDRLQMPALSKHGSFIAITAEEFFRLDRQGR